MTPLNEQVGVFLMRDLVVPLRQGNHPILTRTRDSLAYLQSVGRAADMLSDHSDHVIGAIELMWLFDY